MFEHLTVPARRVLVAATDAAVAIGSHEVEGAHLLLGFLDTSSVVQRTVQEHLPDRDVVQREAQRFTFPSASGARPGFGEEVSLALATARGIRVGRNADAIGTATVLLGLLTMAPRSVDDLLRSRRVDLEAFRRAVAAVDDTGEATTDPSPGGPKWTARIVPDGPDGWDDH